MKRSFLLWLSGLKGMLIVAAAIGLIVTGIGRQVLRAEPRTTILRYFYDFTLAPDGKSFVAIQGRKTHLDVFDGQELAIWAWDVQSLSSKQLATVRSRQEDVFSADYSLDSREVAILSENDSGPIVHLWNTETWNLNKSFVPGDGIQSVYYSGDGSLIGFYCWPSKRSYLIRNMASREKLGEGTLPDWFESDGAAGLPEALLHKKEIAETTKIIQARWDAVQKYRYFLPESFDGKFVHRPFFTPDGSMCIRRSNNGVNVANMLTGSVLRLSQSDIAHSITSNGGFLLTESDIYVPATWWSEAVSRLFRIPGRSGNCKKWEVFDLNTGCLSSSLLIGPNWGSLSPRGESLVLGFYDRTEFYDNPLRGPWSKAVIAGGIAFCGALGIMAILRFLLRSALRARLLANSATLLPENTPK